MYAHDRGYGFGVALAIQMPIAGILVVGVFATAISARGGRFVPPRPWNRRLLSYVIEARERLEF